MSPQLLCVLLAGLSVAGCANASTGHWQVWCVRSTTAVGFVVGGQGGVAISSVCLQEDSVYIVPDDSREAAQMTEVAKALHRRNARSAPSALTPEPVPPRPAREDP